MPERKLLHNRLNYVVLTGVGWALSKSLQVPAKERESKTEAVHVNIDINW